MAQLPYGHEKLEKKSNYLKISKFAKGDTRLRILGTPIAGWEYWVDKKPVRFSPDQGEPKREEPIDQMNKTKSLWWVYVWDYTQQDLFILSIEQASIKSGLKALYNDPEWGDYEKYDIKINKTGEGKDTKYTITPCVPKDLSLDIKKALDLHPVRLEALYEGKDPWKDLEPGELTISTGEITASPAETPFDTLKEHLEVDNIDATHLGTFLDSLVKKSPKPITSDRVIESALDKARLPDFKKKYGIYLKDLNHAIAV